MEMYFLMDSSNARVYQGGYRMADSRTSSTSLPRLITFTTDKPLCLTAEQVFPETKSHACSNKDSSPFFVICLCGYDCQGCINVKVISFSMS